MNLHYFRNKFDGIPFSLNSMGNVLSTKVELVRSSPEFRSYPTGWRPKMQVEKPYHDTHEKVFDKTSKKFTMKIIFVAIKITIGKN